MDDEEEGGGGAGWIVSYADLMTLLFAAFVVLYGLKPEGEAKNVLGVTSSIRESFVEIPDVIPKDQKKGPILKGKAHFQHFKGEQMNPPVIQRYRRASNAIKVIDGELDQIKALVKQLSTKRGDAPEVKPNAGDISVERDNNQIRLKLLSSYLYDSGQIKPKRKSLADLERIGKLIKNLGRDIVIEGHTDAVPATGEISNWDISIGRAAHVARFFINRVQIPKKRISAAGYADTKPVAPNDTAQARALNRRIEIRLKYEK